MKNFIALLCLLYSFQGMASATPLVTVDLASWYQSETSVEPGPYFGIYSIKFIQDQLYLGLGTDRPAAMDGAMLATLPLSGGTPNNLAYLYEQGFIDMMVAEDYLHIPGADPAFSENPNLPQFSWDFGNWYRLNLVEQNSKIELKRNLPFVVHGWGHWYDETSKTLYHATSQVTCPNPVQGVGCYQVPGARGHGALFTSDNLGESWQRIATDEQGLGTYRTYDITGTDNALFVVWSDRVPDGTICGVAVKKKSSKDWIRVKDLRVPCTERLIPVESGVLTLSRNGPFVVMVSENYGLSEDSYLAGKMPGPYISGTFHHLLSSQSEMIYLATRAGVFRTENLLDWQLVTGTEMITNTRAMTLGQKEQTLYLATPTQVFKVAL